MIASPDGVVLADVHDRLLVRSAARRIALQSAALLGIVVTFAVAGAAVAFDRAQHAEIDRTVRAAAVTADDVDDPPLGVLLVEARTDAVSKVRTTSITSSRHAPIALIALLRTAPAGLSSAEVDGHSYVTYGVSRPGVQFVAAYDLAAHHRTEVQLLWSSIAAGTVGVLLAASTGWLVGRRAVRPLASAIALQRRFVTDASHELRTPLTVLHTRAQLIRRRLADRVPADQLTDLDQLVEDSSALGEVVSDLLLSAQLQRESVSGEVVDLGALADAVVASLQPYAAQAGVRLSSRTAPGTWRVLGAPAALRRALVALVDNAVSHTPDPGTVTVQVGPSHGGSDSDGVVEVVVIDDGEGLDPRAARQLTERFARGPAAGGHSRRFGLGLALVDEVIRAHGGSLHLDGAPGQGARVAFRLPRA